MKSSSSAAANSRYSVSLTTLAEATAKFQEDWLDLADNAEAPNPFFMPWFLNPAIRFLDPDNKVRLCAVHCDRKMIGLAPLISGSTYAKIPLKHFSIWKHDHCYNGAPLIRQGYMEDFFKAIFQWINLHPESARFIRFTQCPYPQELEEKLALLNTHGSPRLHLQYSHERAILTKHQDFEEHMASVYSAKKRKELRRQAKRFDELGKATFEAIPINDETVEMFISLENAGWKSKYSGGLPIGRSAEECAFFKNAMLTGANQGGAECLSLTLNGKPVAMLFLLRTGDRLFAFKTTYDEKYAAYSPGARLIIEATRRMLADPSITLFDSCARAGHPVVDSLWPERLRIVQFNVSADSAVDINLLSLAAGLENMKTSLAKRLGHSLTN